MDRAASILLSPLFSPEHNFDFTRADERLRRLDGELKTQRPPPSKGFVVMSQVNCSQKDQQPRVVNASPTQEDTTYDFKPDKAVSEDDVSVCGMSVCEEERWFREGTER